MSYREEFPDFDPATMPEIPASFDDQSWHNDVCPSFIDEAAGVTLYIDHADAAEREFPESTRFTLHWTTDDGDWLKLLCEPSGNPVFVESDDWAEIGAAYERARRVAAGHEIVETLRDWLTAREWQACAAGAADPPDFCDSNEATQAAYVSVFGDDGWNLDDPMTASRANASTRIAARIIRGGFTGADLLAEAAADDSVGLSQTITRNEP